MDNNILHIHSDYNFKFCKILGTSLTLTLEWRLFRAIVTSICSEGSMSMLETLTLLLN